MGVNSHVAKGQRPKYPYFQLTGVQDYSVDCMEWFCYLRDNGVPVAIIEDSIAGFSVWRIGTEARGDPNDKNTDTLIPNEDKLPTGYKIVKEANGFKRAVSDWRLSKTKKKKGIENGILEQKEG